MSTFGPTITRIAVKRLTLPGQRVLEPVLAVAQLVIDDVFAINDFIVKDSQGLMKIWWPDRRQQVSCRGCGQRTDAILKHCNNCKYPLPTIVFPVGSPNPAFERICLHNTDQYLDYVLRKIVTVHSKAEQINYPAGENYSVTWPRDVPIEVTSVDVVLTSSSKGLLSYCAVTFNNNLQLLGIKLVQHGQIRICMPDRRILHPCPNCSTNNHLRALYCGECTGELEAGMPWERDGHLQFYQEIAHPVYSNFRQYLERVVLQAYTEVLALRYQSSGGKQSQAGSAGRPFSAIWTPGQRPRVN